MKVFKLLVRGLTVFYALLWFGGVVSYIYLDGPPAGSAWTAPLFLAVAGALVLIYSPVGEWPLLLAVALLGFAAELMGVAFGFPFGGYRYSDTLFPHFMGVPLVLAAAWLVLFAYVRQMAVRPLLAAAWMTAIDLVIDPLAARVLNFWSWERGGLYYGIPWTNFAGWFLVSLVMFLLPRKPAAVNPRIATLGLSVVLFFTVIAFGAGLMPVGVIGLALVALHARRCFSTRIYVRNSAPARPG